MFRPSDRLFAGEAVESEKVTAAFQPGHDIAALKTYRYLRLGMLAAVAALAYSIFEEHSQRGVSCFLGSISGYYYTPVHPVFIGVMVVIGVTLIAIKGRTIIEDAGLSLAGMMAPIVAFIPTSDDQNGVCRKPMLLVHHYEPAAASSFVKASINNNLHALVFAGYFAIALVVIAYFIQKRATGSATEYTTGTWISLTAGLALVIIGSILLRWAYDLVLDSHAQAACAMFLFLAIAAIANCVFGFRHHHTNKIYASIYGFVGVSMILFGLLFLAQRSHNRSSLNGKLVLCIEAVEIGLFVVFWAAQTVERWNQTV